MPLSQPGVPVELHVPAHPVRFVTSTALFDKFWNRGSSFLRRPDLAQLYATAVRAIAAEEGRFGVRANCVGPGMLTEGMAARLIGSGDLDEHALDVARRNIPLRRFGAAADVAEAVCFLASDRARFISGQKLDVDGGYGA